MPPTATMHRPPPLPTLTFKEFDGRVLARKAADGAPEDYIREALVAVTGNTDDGGDVILPGAFEFKRAPKIVWSHDLKILVGKVLEYVELLPGDARLVEMAPDLAAKGLGALWFRIEFDPQDPESFKAFRKVDFHEDLGWSIGYETPADGFKVLADGRRALSRIIVWEGSPTTFGMNMEARTVTAKALIERYVEDLDLPEEKAKILADLAQAMADHGPEATKSYPALEGSYEEIQEALRDAVQSWALQVYGERDADNDWWASLEGTFETEVVATVRVYGDGGASGTFRFPYVRGEDGSVELGEAEEVEVRATVAPATEGSTPPATETTAVAETSEAAALDLGGLDAKAIEDAVEEAKAGRVLSAANAAALAAAAEAITKVLSAAAPKDDDDKKKTEKVIAREIVPKGTGGTVTAPAVEVPEGKVALTAADLLEMELQTS